MDRDTIVQAIREQLGIRVEPEMAEYLLRQISNGGSGAKIPVLGGDARTGVPVRRMVARSDLNLSGGLWQQAIR